MWHSLRNYFVLFVFLSVNQFSTHAQFSESFNKLHKKPVISIDVSEDGELLASVCADKTIKIWDIVNGKLKASLDDHQTGDVTASFSPDGKYLVTGSWDNDVKIWDVSSGNIVRKLSGHSKSLRAVDYHPTGDFIISAGWDHEIKLWYSHTGVCLKTFHGHSQCIRDVKFSPSGKIFASGGYDLYLKTWDMTTGLVIDSVKAHKYPIEALAFSPDGRFIITGSADNSIKIWETKGLNYVATLVGHTDVVFALDFSSDGNYIVSSSNDNTVRLWDFKTRKNTSILKGHTLGVKAVTFSHSGKSVISGGNDKTIRVWDVSSLNITPMQNTYKGDFTKINSETILQCISPDGENYSTLDRDFIVRFRINDPEIVRLRLFVNKQEYVEYDGQIKRVIKPTLEEKDGYREATYKMYLHYGDNEIQLYGEKQDNSYNFSKIVHVQCYDYSKITENPKLKVLIFNVPSYTDKKFQSGYIAEDTEKLKAILMSQEGKLFQKVLITETSDAKEFMDKLSVLSKECTQPVAEKDQLMILINSQTMFGNAGMPSIVPIDFTEKSTFDNAITYDYIVQMLTNVKSYSFLLINGNNKILKSKKINSVASGDLFALLSDQFEHKDLFSLIISDNPGALSIFDIIAHSFHKQNDANNNEIIELSEVENFLKQTVPVLLFSKGVPPPLFIHANE